MLVGEKVRLTNRLTASLKSYFPQVLDWFEDKDTGVFVLSWSNLSPFRRLKRPRQQPLLFRPSFHELCGYCSGEGGEWQEALGALALVLSHLSMPDFCRMGESGETILSLVESVLSTAKAGGQKSSESDSRTRLQVGADSLALLAG